MRESLLGGPPEGIEFTLPDPEEGSDRFNEFLSTDAGVRLKGGVAAAGGAWAAYAAFGAITAAQVITVGTFFTALSFAAAPAFVVGGIYVLVTADGDLLDALDQVEAVTSLSGAGKASGKYLLKQLELPQPDRQADGPRGPVIELRDQSPPQSTVSAPWLDLEPPPQTDVDQPQMGRPDPVKIDAPSDHREVTPGPTMGGELGGWRGDGGRERDDSRDNQDADGGGAASDGSSAGADTSSDNPCDKLGGAKPEFCD